ncbi:MAG: phospholipid carrier-dependent glycosyltransferase [Scytolyngbya sp. HA4215-MV1]|nr:phospholipid carrier-dependent glycosyltransferase [Scytolyngbya sp. HA4215-MV1]
MNLSKKPADLPRSWFWLGIMGIFLASLCLRFWGLGRFNTLVFDEVYYAKFANNYLTQTPFFDGHPPLSKYIIALGMWLGEQLPFGHDAVNGLTGSSHTPWSYRWLNALTGSLIPLVIVGLAYQLGRRRSYALIAGYLAALDGIFLVESRYALNNVYLVIFGLLGQCFFLLALDFLSVKPVRIVQPSWLVNACLLISGIGFGASASIKWNGLWFLFGAYLVWLAGWAVRWFEAWITTGTLAIASFGQNDVAAPHPLKFLTRIHPIQIILFWAIVPALTYYLEWIPHLHLNPGTTFWDLQKQILLYHEKVGNGPTVHPYCSNWYSWLLMIRPVAYFYERAISLSDPVPSGGPPIANGTEKFIYDVHAIGNPFLWWFSTVALILLILFLITHVQNWQAQVAQSKAARELWQGTTLQTTQFWIGLYLLLNYAANLIPWMNVSRCTFLYHYMGASVFALLAFTGFLDRWLSSSQIHLKRLAWAALGIVLVSFLFWLPIYLGLPLSPLGFRLRMWLPTWI